MFCFLGLPGSGKGVQSILFRENLGIAHIAPGVLLRLKAKKDPEITRKLDLGEFIDDQLVAEIISDSIKNRDHKLFIIDGYPRNYNQAVTLNDTLLKASEGSKAQYSWPKIEIKKVFFLDCPEDVVINRLLNRKICPNCPRSFTAEDSICLHCKCNLERRSDDKLDSITTRINNAKREFSKIFSIFQEKIVFINGNQPILKVYEDILQNMEIA